MNKTIAFQIVLNELLDVPMFKGIYDAKRGNKDFMYGISTVMEHIAYTVNDNVGNDFNDIFLKNMITSEKIANKRRG